MHTEPMKDSEGVFDEWKPSKQVCSKCKTGEVKCRAWDSSCGGYTDYNYLCQCGHSWWVDGCDS